MNLPVLFEKTPFEFILKRVNSKSHIRWDTRSRDIAKRSHEVGTLIDTIHGHATIKVGLYIITVYHLCSHDISIISFSNTISHRHFGIPPSRYYLSQKFFVIFDKKTHCFQVTSLSVSTILVKAVVRKLIPTTDTLSLAVTHIFFMPNNYQQQSTTQGTLTPSLIPLARDS